MHHCGRISWSFKQAGYRASAMGWQPFPVRRNGFNLSLPRTWMNTGPCSSVLVPSIWLSCDRVAAMLRSSHHQVSCSTLVPQLPGVGLRHKKNYLKWWNSFDHRGHLYENIASFTLVIDDKSTGTELGDFYSRKIISSGPEYNWGSRCLLGFCGVAASQGVFKRCQACHKKLNLTSRKIHGRYDTMCWIVQSSDTLYQPYDAQHTWVYQETTLPEMNRISMVA